MKEMVRGEATPTWAGGLPHRLQVAAVRQNLGEPTHHYHNHSRHGRRWHHPWISTTSTTTTPTWMGD
eukprot:COSAG06_NODE_25288_length_640_cov_1.554529_2_plen_66_part_01